MTAAEFVKAVQDKTGKKGRRTRNGWRLHCPAHDDRTPSLDVSADQDGKTVFYCHAKCSFGEVCAAVGVEPADLFPRTNGDRAARRKVIVATYDYTDENGDLLYQKVRYDPKDFRTRRPDGKGGWTWNLGDARRVLYRLPDVLATIKDGGTVYLCEGEKDADAINALADGANFIATTNHEGAGKGKKWREDYSETLRGANVVIIQDKDEAGRERVQFIAAFLRGKAADVRIVEALAGKDAADHLAAGHTLAELGPVATSGTIAALATDATAWEPPVAFGQTDLPMFPTDCLASWHREYVEAVAESKQVPVDMVAMMTLSVIAATCAKKAVVECRNDYIEPLNLYTLTVMHSGERKSAVVEETAFPLRQQERIEQDRVRPQFAEEQNRHEILEQRKKKLQKKACDTDDAAERDTLTAEAAEVAGELLRTPLRSLPRLVADDCTPERAETLLMENDGRIAFVSAEGGIFDVMAGRYSDKENIDVFLKGHSGDPIYVDRMGRQVYVESPALTMGLAVQPHVLEGLAGRPGFRGKGLLARFSYSIPRPRIGTRDFAPDFLPPDVQILYQKKVLDLLALEVDSSRRLCLTLEASKKWREFARRNEKRLDPIVGDMGPIGDWGSKLTGAVLRFAGLIHVTENVDCPWDNDIDADTMERAIRIAEDYLTPHALAAFAVMGADPRVEGAKHALAWLRRQDPRESISLRDLFNGVRRFRRMEKLREVIPLLVEHGYFVPKPQAEGDRGPGRPASPEYLLNPAIWNSADIANFAYTSGNQSEALAARRSP